MFPRTRRSATAERHCANCQIQLSRDESQTFTEFTAAAQNLERNVRIYEAINTIFETGLRVKKKLVPGDSDLRMCYECISILAELFRFYTEFMEMTKETSFIQSLLEESVLWGSKRVEVEGDEDEKLFESEEESGEKDNENEELAFMESEVDPLQVQDPDHFYNMDTEDELIKREVEDADDDYILGSDHSEGSEDGDFAFGSASSRITRSMREVKERRKPKPGKDTPVNTSKRKKALNQIKSNVETGTKRKLNQSKVKSVKSVKAVKSLLKQKSRQKKTPVSVLPGETPKCKFRCPQCKEPFPDKVTLQNHCELTSHTENFKPCPKCRKSFRTGKQYRRHMKSIHGEGISEENVDLRTCNHCSKVFNTPYQLKVHVTCVHATDLPFSCSQCEKKFPTKAYLDTHNRQAHTSKEVQYKCETCDSLYATKNGLQVHVTTKHVAEEEKHYAVCELCGKKFTRPGELRRHLRTHDPNRVKSFKCIEFGCESAFFNQRMLDVHVRTHASTKEALCAICGAGFATAATLRRHLDIVHKGLEPQFSCQICGKGFKQKQNLIQHLRSKSHGGEGHRSQSQQQRKVKGPNLLEGDEGRFGIGIGSWQHQPAVQ